MNITIAFKTSDDEKSTIVENLPNNCNVSFLFNLDGQSRKDLLKKSDILFAWNISKELKDNEINYLESCRFIQLLSAGADHLPFNSLKEDILIASNSGAYAEPMAEHTLGMILALSKSLVVRHLELSNKIFNNRTLNKSLRGLNCGIVGFGGIGKEVAKLLRPLNINILAINTTGTTNEDVAFIGTLKDLDYLLENSDILVLSLPLNKYSYHLIDKEKLSKMKDDAILINVARGDIIVEKDLYFHLKENPKFLAGIDAWWIEPFSHGKFEINYPFFELQNFLGSPHNSALVENIINKAIISALINIKRFLAGKNVHSIVKREDYI
ncbi:MAG: 2-hydroxyacid dehydrogenase [Deferribacterota bacterium]|nr:2-hydroxyacid dehydrogenase [Deferribacterota bacterium]